MDLCEEEYEEYLSECENEEISEVAEAHVALSSQETANSYFKVVLDSGASHCVSGDSRLFEEVVEGAEVYALSAGSRGRRL